MQIIHISQLLVEDRQRTDLKPRGVLELREDIKKNGLLHPLVVEDLANGHFRLLAGERRLEAIKGITAPYRCGSTPVQQNSIPITLFSDLSEEERTEIELHENILRADLDWMEREQAVAKLHRLRSLQHPGQTVTETAKELSKVKDESLAAAKNKVARALLISQHLNDPAVKNARSANEAHQAVLRSMEADVLSRIAKRKKIVSPHTFIHEDFFKIQDQLISSTFDVIIADPPYGMGADSFGSNTTQHHYSDDAVSALALSTEILRAGFHFTKPHAFLFLFCDIDLFHRLREYAREFGWKPWRTPLIWDKASPVGIEPIKNAGFFRNYELILYCRKGERVRGDAMGDVLHIPKISIPGHSSAKPIELYKLLLSRSGNAGDRVLDPCCGVGTIFHAARSLNWIATGIEMDDQCAKLCEAASRGLETSL